MAPSPAAGIKQRLATAIIGFLNSSLIDGTLSSDERESIEVAVSCISDSFKVDVPDAKAQLSVPTNNDLLSIYTAHERAQSEGASLKSTASSQAKPSVTASVAAGTAAQSQDAEKLKGLGNVAMQQKDYARAIEMYSQAISVQATNPIYLSNRAAAYSATQQHELARQDAEMAVTIDPNYTKAWSRLGLAKYALGDIRGSMEAYKSGIDAEGNGGSDAMKKGYETAKRRLAESNASSLVDESPAGPGTGGSMPDFSSLASMFGGGGGGGGGGPDLASLMNNPMMRQMAQNIMQNPQALQSMMSDPRIQEMAQRFAGGDAAGGSSPDLASMMQDPAVAEMARSFMGGGRNGEDEPSSGP